METVKHNEKPLLTKQKSCFKSKLRNSQCYSRRRN